MLCLLRGLKYLSDRGLDRHHACANLLNLRSHPCLSLGRPCLCVAFVAVPPHPLRWMLPLLVLFLALTQSWSLEYYRGITDWLVLILWRLESCFHRADRGESRQTLPEVACTNIGGDVSNGRSGDSQVRVATREGTRSRGGRLGVRRKGKGAEAV